MKLPRRDLAVIAHSACDVDYTGGTEVSPREFLFARPDELHRFARCLCESRRFNCGLAGVLAAIPGAGVGDDDANAIFRNSKRLGEFAANAERPLCSRPHGELALLPLRHRSARLERRMSDVGYRVSLFELLVGLRKTFGNRAARICRLRLG